MGEALTIRVRPEQGYAVVAVAGEVDIATVTRLRERLFELAASGRTLVVDLDQVSFIDSAGLAALVGTARRAAAHGTRLQVVCTRPRTRQLFRLTGLDGPVPLACTLDGALESLAAAQTAELIAAIVARRRGCGDAVGDAWRARPSLAVCAYHADRLRDHWPSAGRLSASPMSPPPETKLAAGPPATRNHAK